MSSTFARTAAEVQKALSSRPQSEFSRVAAEVQNQLVNRKMAADRDAEWQRVNSYIADTLKDTHVLYAKLARLQGDFAGAELDQLQKISEAVLVLGDELSVFSKDFYEGKYQMQQSEFVYGDQGGAPVPNPEAAPAGPPSPPAGPPAAAPTSAPEGDEDGAPPPPASEEEEENYDIPVELADEGGEEEPEEEEKDEEK